MTDIINILARSSIILDFNLSTDASYNKLLYELFIFAVDVVGVYVPRAQSFLFS